MPVIKLVSQLDGNNILIDITFSIESPKGTTDSSPLQTGPQWDVRPCPLLLEKQTELFFIFLLFFLAGMQGMECRKR